MENQQFTPLVDDENNDNKSGSCMKSCLTVFLSMAGLFILLIISINIIDHIPRTITTEKHNTYIVELQAKSSPVFPFGPQDGRIVLKNNSRKICKVDFVLFNDGKSMDEDNWKVKWETDKVIITIMGEEQTDEIYNLYYNGEVEK
ncbi:MAG: hypothetical protein K2G36_10175 [Ruminococcus sp.]|nr:hypothetical protein [Ruminococcus sp.]